MGCWLAGRILVRYEIDVMQVQAKCQMRGDQNGNKF
jgi:hypothetical protein